MKKTMTEYEFVREMGDSFSREALLRIFDYYEDIEVGCNIDIEFDPVAFCCEWREDAPENIFEDYSHLLEDEEYSDDFIETLSEYTTVFKLENGNILMIEF